MKSSAIALILLASAPAVAQGYCGREDGPALRAAHQALETGDASTVLAWIGEDDENEVMLALAKARSIRDHGEPVRDVADRWVVDTVARLHCSAVGEEFLGVVPAGADLGPALPLVDRAVKTGDVRPLVVLLQRAVERGVTARFREVKDGRGNPHRFAVAYTRFVQLVGALHALATWAEDPNVEDEEVMP